MHGFPFDLQDALVVLVAAGVIAPALHRARVSPVLAFLLIGLVVGPYGLARFSDAVPWLEYVTIGNVEGTAHFAELGVVALLFVIGLEVPVARLWAMRRLVFGLGGLQILVSGSVIAAAALAFGNTGAGAFTIGAAFALSSTAIVLQLLAEKGRMGSPTGRTALGILLMQDLAVVPILLFVGVLGGASDEPAHIALAKAAVTAVVVIAAIFVAGRLGARPFLRFAAAARAPELFTGAVLLLVVITAAATAAAQLSLALGAFLAGLLLAETEYRHDIEVTIAPFKGLFLGLFFMSVGMSVDLATALSSPLWLAVSVIGLIAVKGLIILVLARLFGQSWATSAESALLLGGGGEFAFVIVGMAAALSVVDPATGQFMVLLAGVTMTLTPLLTGPARALARRLEARGLGGDADAPEDLSDHVVIIGFGRVGRLLAQVLGEMETPYTAIDADAELVARSRAMGRGVHFGDAAKPEMLAHLATERAAVVVVTMDARGSAEAVVKAVRAQWPNVRIVARARDVAHAQRLAALGADDVIPETLEASLDLAGSVLRSLGVPDDTAINVIEARRRAEMASLLEAVRREPLPKDED